MRRVAPHLYLARTRFSNVWLHRDASGRAFLIDTGHPLERLILLADLWSAGIRMPGDLTAVLLTHRHSDHAGNAAWLRKHFGARVYCHKNDAAYLTGSRTAAPLNRHQAVFFKNWLCGVEDRYPAFTEVDEVYEEGLWRWGFRVTLTPGHTEGSVMIHHELTATLYSGDSILVGFPWNRRAKRLRYADPDFSVEPATAYRSVHRFLEHLPRIEILCSGHGPAVDERARQKLLKLLDEGRPALEAGI